MGRFPSWKSPGKQPIKKRGISEKNKGGWKTQGRGKHTIKPLARNGFGPPHLWYVSPPPVCFRPVVFLRGNRHRPGKSHFLRPPKLVLEGALYGTFSPPPESHDTFCPPISRFPSIKRLLIEVPQLLIGALRLGWIGWKHPFINILTARTRDAQVQDSSYGAL